jgi:hypothetical protein
VQLSGATNHLANTKYKCANTFYTHYSYITRAFLFKNRRMDIISAIDFDVLALLAGIMAINHIIVHLKETKRVIVWMQTLIQQSPVKGFWMISTTAFLLAPFLTNDGVCLLFVEIILNAFGDCKDNDKCQDVVKQESLSHSLKDEDDMSPLLLLPTNQHQSLGVSCVGLKNKLASLLHPMKLEKGDAVFFLLSLACSSNIGSSLTCKCHHVPRCLSCTSYLNKDI